MAQLQVRDPQNAPVPDINIRIALGQQSSDDAIFDVVSDKEGNQSWPVPFWPHGFYMLHVNMREANGSQLKFDPRFAEAHIPVEPGDHNVEIPLVLAEGGEPAGGSLDALVSVDPSVHRFVTENGRRQFLRGVTSFLIYKRFLDGEDLRPLLSQLQGLGCNMVRLFGMVTSFSHWHPQDYFGRGYYERIPEFMDLAASFGQYVLWTPCADTQQIMPTGWLQHMQLTLQQLKPVKNKLISFVNEQGQHENGIDRQLAYNTLKAEGLLDGTVFDTGSFGEDAPCEAPFGTHVVLHVRRAYPSHVKDCCTLDHPNRVNAPHLEVLLDEPDRYGEGGNMNLGQARDSAATSYCSLGFVLHTSQGVQSQPFSGRTLEIANTVFPLLKGF